jgi:hypothetical protein
MRLSRWRRSIRPTATTRFAPRSLGSPTGRARRSLAPMNLLRRLLFSALSMWLSDRLRKPGCPPLGASPAVVGVSTGCEQRHAGRPEPPSPPASEARTDGAPRARPGPGDDGRATLRDGWRLASSAKVRRRGAIAATAGYRDGGVVRGARAGTPFSPRSSRPGSTRSRTRQPAAHPGAKLARSWCTRREFELATAPTGQVWLGFDGINYCANIWLNGQARCVGEGRAWHVPHYRFDVTELAWKGQKRARGGVFRPGRTILPSTGGTGSFRRPI